MIIFTTDNDDPIEEDDDPLLHEARLQRLERITGIPRRDASRTDKICMWITYQVHHRLAILGVHKGFMVAVIVLAIDVAFMGPLLHGSCQNVHPQW